MIVPVPKGQPRKKKAIVRKKGSTRILTETPPRDEIAGPSERKYPKPKNDHKRKSFGTCTKHSDSDSDFEIEEGD